MKVVCPSLQSEEVAEQDVNSDLSVGLSEGLNSTVHCELSAWPACCEWRKAVAASPHPPPSWEEAAAPTEGRPGAIVKCCGSWLCDFGQVLAFLSLSFPTQTLMTFAPGSQISAFTQSAQSSHFLQSHIPDSSPKADFSLPMSPSPGPLRTMSSQPHSGSYLRPTCLWLVDPR